MKALMYSCATVRYGEVTPGIRVDLQEQALVLGTSLGDMARVMHVACNRAHPPLLEKCLGPRGEVLDEEKRWIYAATLELGPGGCELGGAHDDSELTRAVLVLIDTRAEDRESALRDGRFRQAKAAYRLALGHGVSNADKRPRGEWQQVLFRLYEGSAVGVIFSGTPGADEYLLTNVGGELQLALKPLKFSPARAAAEAAFAACTIRQGSNGTAQGTA